VREVLGEDLLEMTAIEDEEPVEALPADAADEALGKRVRPCFSRGRLDEPDALGMEDLIEVGGELLVPVPEEELDCSGALGEYQVQVAGPAG
jgi:hypothetical protein